MERVICIIQARMGSSRLPGKVLKDICGQPMLAWVVERARQAKRIDEVVVATTTDSDDDAVAAFCLDQRIECFRGDVFDVLNRYYQTALHYQADIIVRLTGDCPLVDPQLIDRVVEALRTRKLDFVANRLPPPYKRTFPIGLDVEAATMQALSEAWQHAERQMEREHVMPYLYAGSKTFKTFVVDAEADYGAQRWTVDTPQDLEFVREVAKLLDCRKDFTWLDVLALVKAHPELTAINADVHHKSVDEIDERTQEK